MRLLILVLILAEMIETGLRWLYCQTIFNWVTRWQLERMYPRSNGKE